MKKFIYVALAVVGLTSCVQNEELFVSHDGNAITFDNIHVENATRAAIEDVEKLSKEAITLLDSFEHKNEFLNQLIEEFSDIYKIKQDTINVREVVDSRNYYSHFMDRKKKKHIVAEKE